MTQHVPLGFEPGDTMVEFVRVLGEACLRRGFEVGYATAGVIYSGDHSTGRILRLNRRAVELSPSLDVEWFAEDDAMMLGLHDRDDNLPVIGISERTYDTLNSLKIVPEEDDG